MKRSVRMVFCLLVLLVFSVSLCASAGADSLVETILKTGTTQSFTSDPVPDEDIQAILQAGVSTASAINQQPWYFVVITNQDLMKEIGSSGMDGGSGRPDSAPGREPAPRRKGLHLPKAENLKAAKSLPRRLVSPAVPKHPSGIPPWRSLCTRIPLPSPPPRTMTAAWPPRTWSSQLHPWDTASRSFPRPPCP